MELGGEDAEQMLHKTKHKGKHDKPKPWYEDPNIDRWKVEKFDPAWNAGGMLQVSSFSTLFSQYREKYLQEAWAMVRSTLSEHGISCELNLISIREIQLKALFGKFENEWKVVEDCILNKMHPLYNIKIFMMKKELANDPAFANENWDRFLHKFKQKIVKQNKVKGKEKKPYTPFPPPQPPSKEPISRQSKPVDSENDLNVIAMSLKNKAKKLGKRKSDENINPEDYIAGPSVQKPVRKKKRSVVD